MVTRRAGNPIPAATVSIGSKVVKTNERGISIRRLAELGHMLLRASAEHYMLERSIPMPVAAVTLHMVLCHPLKS